ncbi:MAG: Ig-like domain-containing protein [SAR324 cluster bacterium]|nr:Ig-like domain-containing protein [SAR324 cluster bacterium]
MKYSFGIVSILLLLVTGLFYGCEEEPITGNRLVPGRLVPGRLVPGRLAGNVSNGFALPKTPVTFVSADGQTELSTITDEKGNYSVEVSDTLTFPVLIVASTSNTSVSSIVTSAPAEEEENTANVNPITQVVTLSALENDAPTAIQRLLRKKTNGQNRLVAASLSEITVTDYDTVGETISELAFGTAVDFASFSSAAYQARTSDNPAGGNYQDTLIDSVATLSSVLTIEEVLTKAVDPNDPSFDGGMLESESFRAKVSGQLIAQGRSGTEALDVITAGVTADSGTLLENSTAYVGAFEGIVQDAITSGLADQSSREALVSASAGVIANTLDANTLTDGASLTTLLDNTVATAGPALISIGQQNQDIAQSGELGVLLNAMSNELSTVLADNAVDMTIPLSDATGLRTQLTNFGQALAAPLASSLKTNTGGATGGGQRVQGGNKKVLIQNIAKQVSESLTPFMNDFTSGIPDAAKNTANNLGSALDTSLKNILLDSQSQSLGGSVREKFVKQVAKAAVKQIKKTGADLSAGTLPPAALNTANNMASIALGGMAAVTGISGDLASEDAKASVATATLEQTFEAVADLDLTGDLPPEANTVVNNVGQVVGPALIESVGGVSNRKGENLSVLIKSAASAVSKQMKDNGIDLKGAITDVTAVRNSAVQKASETSISMEQTFQKIEKAGVKLGDMTKGFENIDLDAGALLVVASQVAETVAGEGTNDNIKGATSSITKAAAQTAKNVIQKGGSIDQVKQSVSVTTAAVKDVAKTGNAKSIKNSAKALESSVKAAGQGGGSIEDFLAITKNVATGVTTAGDAGVANLVKAVQVNVSQGGPLELANLVPPGQLAEAQAKQVTLNQEAQTFLAAVDEILVANETGAQAAVAAGQGLGAFNPVLVQTAVPLPPNADGNTSGGTPGGAGGTSTGPSNIADFFPTDGSSGGGDTLAGPGTDTGTGVPFIPPPIDTTTTGTGVPFIPPPTDTTTNTTTDTGGGGAPPGGSSGGGGAPPGGGSGGGGGSFTPTTIPGSRACTSSGHGPLILVNSPCNSAIDTHVIGSGHTVHWDGTGAAIASHVAIHPGSTFIIHTSGGTLHGNLALHGGTFHAQSNVTINGNIIHHAHNSMIRVDAGNVLTYNGLSVPLGPHTLQLDIAGLFNKPNNFLIPQRGELYFTGGGTMNTPITLSGGRFTIDSDLTLQGDIIHNFSSVMSVAKGTTFNYYGAPLRIGDNTLAITGGGAIVNNNAIVLNAPNSTLQIGGGTSVQKVAVSSNSLITGQIEVAENTTIDSFALSDNVNIILTPGKTLTLANTVKVDADVVLTITGNVGVEDIRLKNSLNLNGDAPILADDAILKVASTATFGPGSYLTFGGGLIVDKGVTLTIDDPDVSSGAIFYGGATINGQIVLAGDDDLSFDPSIASTSNITVTGSGTVFNEHAFVLATLSTDNRYLDLKLSKRSFASSNGTGALGSSDFSLAFSQNSGNASNVTIGSLTQTNDDPLVGGETDVRFHFTIAGSASGVETIAITPADGNSIFDIAGNPASTALTTDPITLNDLSFDLTSNLMAYYSFNGNANDNSGNNKHTFVKKPSLTADVVSMPNNAYQFNGTGDALIASTILSIDQDPLTIAAWIYLDDIVGDKPIFGEYASNGDFRNYFYVRNDGLAFDQSNPAGGDIFADANFVSGQWEHVALVKSSDQVTFYHNGSSVGSHTHTETYGGADPSLSAIGAKLTNGTPSTNFFAGKIDEVRIYTRALKSNEIHILSSMPAADPGQDRFVSAGETITLDGSDSRDSDGGLVFSHQWAIAGEPSGSSITLNNPNTATANFTPSVSGDYSFVLAVSDGTFGTTNTVNVVVNDWQLASSPASWSSRVDHASLVFDNKLWIVGGFGSGYLNDVYYSSNGMNWTQSTASAGWDARSRHASIIFDNKQWVLGGFNGTDLNDVWYSRDGTNWTLATSNAAWTSRGIFTSVVFNGKIWTMGGVPNGSSALSDVWYSSNGIDWTQATMNVNWGPRYGQASVVFDGKIWVMGGHNGSTFQNDVWYSEDGINWTQATAGADWSARARHTSVVYDGKIWVMGGKGSSNNNDVWYSDDGIHWTEATAGAPWSARQLHVSTVFQNRIWVMGGIEFDTTYKNDVWSYSQGIEGSLVAYYPFNGNADDASGLNHHGVPVGAALTTDRFGMTGGAYSFDGVDDIINRTSSSILNPTGQITVTAWVKPADLTTNTYYTIVRKETQYLLAFQNNGSYLTFGLNDNASYEADASISSGSFTDGSWHFVAGSYDGTTLKVYNDGVLIGSTVASTTINTSTNPLQIGGYSVNTELFNGAIDDVRIYNRALTDVEILNLFRAPVAVADNDLVVDIENTITVYNNSQSANGNSSLNYNWELVDQPPGSSAQISATSTSSITLAPDELGKYEVRLSIADGSLKATDYVNVYADVDTASLVAFYPFDGNFQDVSGNGNHGTIASSSTAPTLASTNWAGKLHNGYDFDGIDDEFDLPQSTSLNLGNQSLTWMAWVKLDTYTTGSNSIILSSRDNTNGYLLSIIGSGAGSTGQVNFGDSTSVISTSVIPLNTWTHITATLDYQGGDANVAKVYVNGILESQISNMPDSGTWTEGIEIGGRPVAGADFNFDGLIDDVRIYNTALSAEQIQQFASSLDNGLVAYYPMNGDASDASGNGYDGTVSSAVSSLDRFGNTNSSYNITGASQSILIPQNTIDGLADYTLASWIKLDSVNSGSNTLFSGARAAEDNAFIWYYQGSSNMWNMMLDSTSAWMLGNGTIEDMGWHHVAVSRIGTTTNMYVDGDLIGSNSIASAAVDVDAGGVIFGQEQDSVGGGFQATDSWNGSADDFRIYNRALTEIEIEALIEESSPFTMATTISSDNMTFIINFNEGVFSSSGGALTASDFNLTFDQNGGNSLDVSIASIANSNDSTLVGGEPVIKFNLAVTGVASGLELIYITPAANAVFDADGNPISGVATLVTSLNAAVQPYVTSTAPADQTAGVSIATTVDVTFDSVMNAGTITTSTFTLATSSGSSVSGTVSYNSGNQTVTFTPATSLTASTTYVATLASGIQDSIGNALATTSFSFDTVDLSSNMVAYYNFDNNANDHSGNSHHGTLNGTVTSTTDRFGNADHAYSFDGSSGYITLPDSNDWDYGANDYTIGFWINTTQTTRAFLYSRAGGGTLASGDIVLEFTNGANPVGSITANFESTTGGQQDGNGLISPTIHNGSWRHFVLVRNGSTLTMYVDGAAVSTKDISSYMTLQDVNYPVTIGRYAHNQPSAYFNGKLDEYVIYSRALTQAEIDTLYSLDSDLWDGALWDTNVWGD